MNESIKESINEYLNKGLATCKLPFTYSNVELVKSKYYDEKNYEVETLFMNYNGTDTNHKNVVNCYDGNKSQIMFEFSGFPGAAVVFDRELIPEDGLKYVIKAATFEQRRKDLSEDIKKANI